MTDWLTGDYEDINRAMCDAFEPQKVEIYGALKKRTQARKRQQIENLKQELQRLGVETK